MITIAPIENYRPNKYAALISEALGELVPTLLAELRTLAHPMQVILAETAYSVQFTVKNVVDDTTEDITLSHTAVGDETEAVLLSAIESAFNALDTNLHTSVNSSANSPYLTVVTKEGFVIDSAPTLVGITIDTDTQVQAPMGKPAAFGTGQEVLEQDYPRLIVSHLADNSVSENWTKGAVVLRDIGDGLEYYPYEEAYIAANYQVTCEAGSMTEVHNGRAESGQILRKIIMKLKEDNRRNEFYQKVQGTINRDFTITRIPSVSFNNHMDTSVMTITLDHILREIDYDAGYITRVDVDGGATVEYPDGSQPIPIEFTGRSPSHID